jgi:hypothetical protein
MRYLPWTIPTATTVPAVIAASHSGHLKAATQHQESQQDVKIERK